MRKINYAFLAAIVVGLFITSCAKENNKYDKILTDGEWTLSELITMYEEIENEDNSGVGAIDVKTTSKNTNTSSNGTTGTMVIYNETAESPGSTTFTEYTVNYESSVKMTFNEDGTYTTTNSMRYTTASGRNESGSLGTFNYTDPADVTTTNDYWSWGNTAETKTQINLGSMGMYDVKVEKGKVTFTRNTKTNEVDNSSSGGVTTVTTTTTTDNQSMTATK